MKEEERDLIARQKGKQKAGRLTRLTLPKLFFFFAAKKKSARTRSATLASLGRYVPVKSHRGHAELINPAGKDGISAGHLP
jgi:hypothetical protein